MLHLALIGRAAIASCICVAIMSGIAAGQPPSGDSVLTIESGTYEGASVPMHSQKLLRSTRHGSSFLRSVRMAKDERFVGHDPARFPIAVAFRHGRGEQIAAADSIAYWTILNQMEADMGIRLFLPATIRPDVDPVDVIVVGIKPSAGADGLTLITWTSGGEVYDARVYVSARTSLGDPRIVTHEMMHALGFGHTDRWASVMNSPGGRIARLTPGDVAHAQLSFRSRTSAAAFDMRTRLALALEREPVAPVRTGDECRYSSPSFECAHDR